MPPEHALRRVVLHLGPPKTGTSALQSWCGAHGAELERHGVRYAAFDRADDPKHQWLLKELRSGRFDRTSRECDRLRSGTLVLSCEGVMVHRRAIQAAHWAGLRHVLQGIDTQIFLVQRRTDDWVRSLWVQGVLNPGGQGGPAMPPLEDFTRSSWLREMVALPDLARRMAVDTGATGVTIASYEDDWFGQFLDLAGLPRSLAPDGPPRTHETPPLAFAHLYRALAAGLSDPGPLRRALFAVYCRAVPTSNLTLRNTARDFARQDRAQQVDHLTDLAARLRVLAGGLHEQGHLAARLMSALADWPDQR